MKLTRLILTLLLLAPTLAPAQEQLPRRLVLQQGGLFCLGLLLGVPQTNAADTETWSAVPIRFADVALPALDDEKLSDFESGLELVSLNTVELLRDMGWISKSDSPSRGDLAWRGKNTASNRVYETFRWAMWKQIRDSLRAQTDDKNIFTIPVSIRGPKGRYLNLAPRFEITLLDNQIVGVEGKLEAQLAAIRIVHREHGRSDGPAILKYQTGDNVRANPKAIAIKIEP